MAQHRQWQRLPHKQQLKLPKAAVKAMTEAAGLAEYSTRRNAAVSGPKVGRPQLRQPTFEYSAQNKYDELKNFKWGDKYFHDKTLGYNRCRKHNHSQELARQRGHTSQWDITNGVQDICKSSTGLFKMLNEKFKLQHNETILSLQYRKLLRDNSKSVPEWMGWLIIGKIECKYQEDNRWLRE